MMISNTSGFTAVEVLIALLIGSTLLLGGYQAYTAVTTNSRDARERSVAGNVAYKAAREEAGAINGPCSASTKNYSQNEILLPTGTDKVNLPGPISMQRVTSCPFSPDLSISQVTVTLTYGADNKKVVHALYGD